jgi:hypothetical protein
LSAVDEKNLVLACLRRLFESEPASVEQASGWYQRAEFIKDVLRSVSYEIGVSHVIWHYLDDADIRIRDPRYAEAQVLAVRQSIDEWA